MHLDFVLFFFAQTFSKECKPLKAQEGSDGWYCCTGRITLIAVALLIIFGIVVWQRGSFNSLSLYLGALFTGCGSAAGPLGQHAWTLYGEFPGRWRSKKRGMGLLICRTPALWVYVCYNPPLRFSDQLRTCVLVCNGVFHFGSGSVVKLGLFGDRHLCLWLHLKVGWTSSITCFTSCTSFFFFPPCTCLPQQRLIITPTAHRNQTRLHDVINKLSLSNDKVVVVGGERTRLLLTSMRPGSVHQQNRGLLRESGDYLLFIQQ